MVRFNMRSLAFMAFAVFAAASPVAESVNHPAAAVLPAAPAPVGGVALPQVPQEQFVRDERNVVQAVPVMQGMMVPQQGADSKVSQQAASQACRMVPCSESECMKYLNPEEQKEFKRQCEQMKLEQMKTAKAKGQSRIAQGNFELTFYRMIPNQQANASGVATNGIQL
ncbi:hypothetical protein BX070DRAFT_218827 [Coemansia spiralis]|nr:hypothetical protein BX070DRAFT_218827 [Coemansia spiralis]